MYKDNDMISCTPHTRHITETVASRWPHWITTGTITFALLARASGDYTCPSAWSVPDLVRDPTWNYTMRNTPFYVDVNEVS